MYYPDGDPTKAFPEGDEPTDPISVLELVVVLILVRVLYTLLGKVFPG